MKEHCTSIMYHKYQKYSSAVGDVRATCAIHPKQPSTRPRLHTEREVAQWMNAKRQSMRCSTFTNNTSSEDRQEQYPTDKCLNTILAAMSTSASNKNNNIKPLKRKYQLVSGQDESHGTLADDDNNNDPLALPSNGNIASSADAAPAESALCHVESTMELNVDDAIGTFVCWMKLVFLFSS